MPCTRIRHEYPGSVPCSGWLGYRDEMIRFEGVTKRYAGTVAVDDVTLVAPTGKITVLVGPSGCGKTTTLRMVNRMVIPTSGTITLDGRNTASLDEADLRRGIGYVIQHAGLFPHRTVVDNVATVPRLLGWDKARARARAIEVLERVGLDDSYSAATRRSRARPRSRPARPAHGRAVLRCRPHRARAAPTRSPCAATGSSQDDPLRHA